MTKLTPLKSIADALHDRYVAELKKHNIDIRTAKTMEEFYPSVKAEMLMDEFLDVRGRCRVSLQDACTG